MATTGAFFRLTHSVDGGDSLYPLISTSDDISKHNNASKPSSGANTIVRYCSRGIYNHYAIPRDTTLVEIQGFAELEGWSINRFLRACQGKIAEMKVIRHAGVDVGVVLLSTPACLITFMPVSQVVLDRLIPVPSIDLEEQKKSWQGQTTILLFSSDAETRESSPKVLDCTYRYRRPRLTL